VCVSRLGFAVFSVCLCLDGFVAAESGAFLVLDILWGAAVRVELWKLQRTAKSCGWYHLTVYSAPAQTGCLS
jgi:hypothetical protein